MLVKMEKFVYSSEDLSRNVSLKNGKLAILRPINVNDDKKLYDFFFSCSKDTIFYRFMSTAYYNNIRTEFELAKKKMREYASYDLSTHMSIVAIIQEDDREMIVSEGRYFRTSKDTAEVAIMTTDEWQRLGLATYLVELLKDIALSRGITIFKGDILVSNEKMLKVFKNLRIKYKRLWSGSSIHFEVELEDPYYD